MKIIKSIFLYAALAGSASLISCSNDDALNYRPSGILTVEIEMQNESRAPIMSNVFPDGTEYGIVCINNNDANDVQMRSAVYSNGESTISGDPIVLQDYLYTVGAFYPYKENALESWSTGIEVNMSSQTDYLFGLTTGLTYNKSIAHINLQHAMALVTFKVRKDNFITQEYELKSLCLEGINTWGNFNPQKLDYDKYESGSYTQKAYQQLGSGDDFVTLDILVVPTEKTSVQMGLNINERPVMNTAFNINGWSKGYRYVYTVTVTSESVEIEEASIQPWTNAEIINVDNTAAAPGNPVDLGVSKLWADRNLGAYSISDYGKYLPVSDMTNALNTEWGSKWAVPSDDDFNELMEKCTLTWTVVNNIQGMNVTGNGNTIFIPAAGWITDTSLHNINWGGTYGTSNEILWDFSNQKAPAFVNATEGAKYCLRPIQVK